MSDDEEFAVKKLCRKVEKMNAARDYDEALDVLQQLRRIGLSLKLLKDTGVGFRVNKLRKCCRDKEVERYARKVIKGWQVIVRDAYSYGSSSESDSIGGNRLEALVAQRATKRQAAKRRKENESRNANKRVEVFEERTDPRAKSVQLLVDALKTRPNHYKDLSDDKVRPIAVKIEKCIYSEFKDVGAKYLSKVRSRIMNLKDPKNPELRTSVLYGYITPEYLCEMTSAEMASRELKEERKKINEEALASRLVRDEDAADAVACPQCKAVFHPQHETLTSSGTHECIQCGHMFKAEAVDSD
ncbi:Transcription elongation factor A protein 1 [Halotydeus destructor]|nr:Transcription elongation factor A protein 1 [Halotydeus destructor]